MLWLISLGLSPAQPIDRQSVVDRHCVIITQADTLGSLTVGNGRFAFTVDATGLQSFPEQYGRGIPLGTQSEWGWHRFPNPAHYQFSESLRAYPFNGKPGQYAVQWQQPDRNRQAADYFRQNPHRLQLGNVGLVIQKKDGSLATLDDVQQIHQALNLWTGEINSRFVVEGIPVSVTTCAHAVEDVIGVRIESPLLAQQRLRIRVRFPYPTNTFTDVGINYTHDAAHQTNFRQPTPETAIFSRRLDKATYTVTAHWQQASIQRVGDHNYTITPAPANQFALSVRFSPAAPARAVPTFAAVQRSSRTGWAAFWASGAAVDFSGSTDSRANELERRVVLSQYLTRVQGAGAMPPQETGLTYNSWYGRPHLEMYWWHAAHYALWGRPALLEKSMNWYFAAFADARQIARRQGFPGVRWQKMTDPAGDEAPSSVGSFLIWQQPHLVYLAELLYRQNPSWAVLHRYEPLITATADFMAAFAQYDSTTSRYNLGPGIIPAQECFDPVQTYNPPYELAYWKWGLQVAQQWRTRLGLPPRKSWQIVIDRLAPLDQQDGLYTAAQSVTDSYSPRSSYTIDHPAVLAALSSLPPNGMVDTAVMHKTYETIEQVWHWKHTWGWDFPMMAMTATRLNQPDKAIAALFNAAPTNTYLVNGHNYQDKRLTLYLPGNGGLLAAIALMCTGGDGITTPNPGFPKNGQWRVRWEGLKRMP